MSLCNLAVHAMAPCKLQPTAACMRHMYVRYTCNHRGGSELAPCDSISKERSRDLVVSTRRKGYENFTPFVIPSNASATGFQYSLFLEPFIFNTELSPFSRCIEIFRRNYVE